MYITRSYILFCSSVIATNNWKFIKGWFDQGRSEIVASASRIQASASSVQASALSFVAWLAIVNFDKPLIVIA